MAEFKRNALTNIKAEYTTSSSANQIDSTCLGKSTTKNESHVVVNLQVEKKSNQSGDDNGSQPLVAGFDLPDISDGAEFAGGAFIGAQLLEGCALHM